MEIRADDYSVEYDPITEIVSFQGSLRLSGTKEYAPITELLNEVVGKSPETINLNFQKLEFLNSSGIYMLSKFVIKVREQENINITIHGSKSIPWQGKSLKNFQKLMPALQLQLE
jgi:hypothetical protein